MNDNKDQSRPSMDGQAGNDSSHDEPTQSRRPYSPPALVVWGTLRDITQSVGSSGRRDGGRGRQRRTRW
ncbi:MAG: lasso RiPP family leader peptide-containing protein [Alphaproteobacteria bacterium]|nr:lasso RiPP family leader peptide-containing protein [Alphaproteobacteria bacterium]